MQFIAFFEPLGADVGAIEHVLQHDVFNAAIGLPTRTFDGAGGTGDDEDVAAFAGELPVILDEFHVAEMDAVEILTA